MAQLNFRGVDLPSFVRVEKVETSLFPKKRINLISIPNRYGSVLSNVEFAERVITIAISIMPNSNETILSKQRLLTEWLGFEVGDLILSEEPDKKYKAIVSNDVDINDLVFIGKGKIEFLCADPCAYALTESSFQTSSSSFSINNTGSFKTYPIIDVLMASSKNYLKIEDIAKGKMLQVNYPFAQGNSLQIDCSKKIIKINGVVNMKVLDLNSDWIALEKGLNNFVVTPSNQNDQISIKYFRRWI